MSDPARHIYDTPILDDVAEKNATMQTPLSIKEEERFRRFLAWHKERAPIPDSELAYLIRDWLWWDSVGGKW